MRVELIRKLADHLDGVDVSAYDEGDVLDLPVHEAELLLAEHWARRPPRRRSSTRTVRAVAAEGPLRRRTIEQLRQLRAQMDRQRLEQQERRRAEDRIREELHDARARTISAHSSGS